ncbi:MAG: hypothetical protein BGO31_12600 [Bacteroidetes bacterium 43-16]|nr:MAG: hypothetical protein BGO31_12600 [Bacteroidetes bacterium 43-16]
MRITDDIIYKVYDILGAEALKTFQENYELVNIIEGSTIPNDLISPERRVCRFCQKRHPDTSFQKKAHIIPHQLGSEHLVSDFECDKCNEVFGLYESQLANFLSVFRTMHKIKGKKKIPEFVSGGNTLHAKVGGFHNLRNIISVSDKNGFELDLDSGIIRKRYEQPPYKPLQVFKALAHIGFCMLNEDEVEDFRDYIHLGLMNGSKDQNCKNYPAFTLFVTRLPRVQSSTFALLFKKNNDRLIADYELIIFCRNLMFQLSLPLHKNGNERHRDFVRHILPGGHFIGDDFESQTPVSAIDLSDIELKKEEGYFEFRLDPEYVSKISKLSEDEQKEHSSIRKIFISSMDAVLRVPPENDLNS